jgi:hypothetical protein
MLNNGRIASNIVREIHSIRSLALRSREFDERILETEIKIQLLAFACDFVFYAKEKAAHGGTCEGR